MVARRHVWRRGNVQTLGNVGVYFNPNMGHVVSNLMQGGAALNMRVCHNTTGAHMHMIHPYLIMGVIRRVPAKRSKAKRYSGSLPGAARRGKAQNNSFKPSPRSN